MNSSPSQDEPWQLEADVSQLQLGPLDGTLDVANPARGLTALQWNKLPLNGFVLGVSADTELASVPNNRQETFVRGNDLVVTYAQEKELPFSCQIYWRATPQEHDAIILEAIISVQTELLESFPKIHVESQLASDEVWLVSSTGEPAKRLDDSTKEPAAAEGIGCVVLRGATADLSYAEMTHPEDMGSWQIKESAEKKGYTVRRQLGGAFLEKGVIRRMRVRGVFLPRENDLELATQYLASLATESPPLTT